MDIKEIKQVVELMKRSDLLEFELEKNDLKLRIRRNSSHNNERGYSQEGAARHASGAQQPFSFEQTAVPLIGMPQGTAYGATQSPFPNLPVAAVPQKPSAPAESSDIAVLKSPMVGTFYRSSAPDAAPFVSRGSEVQADTVVCIIEAMKVMNEIHAEQSGTIVEVLVENGKAVEFGQPLFKIKQP